MAVDHQTLNCNDACGASVHDAAAAQAAGWQMLQVTGRYRCVECWRKLNAINGRSDYSEPAKVIAQSRSN